MIRSPVRSPIRSAISSAINRIGGGMPIDYAVEWPFFRGDTEFAKTPWAAQTRTGLGTRIGPDGLIVFGMPGLGANEAAAPLNASPWVTLGSLSTITADSFTNTSGAGAGRRIVLPVGPAYTWSITYTKSDASTLFSVSFDPVSGTVAGSSTAASGTLSGTTASNGHVYLRLGGNATLTVTSISVRGPSLAPRIDYDPVTLAARGLLVEGQATEEINSHSLASPQMVTQTITVTAAQRTFSFYGTGTVTMTGAHSATVVGTGAYPSRKTYTFTPSAGSLTLTVSGTVQYPQLILGSVATSYIPNPGTGTAVRVADDWYLSGGALAAALGADTSVGAVFAEFVMPAVPSGAFPGVISIETPTERLAVWVNPAQIVAIGGYGGAAPNAEISPSTAISPGSVAKVAFRWTSSGYRGSVNGSPVTVSTNARNLSGATTLRIGKTVIAALYLNSIIRSVRMLDPNIPDAALQALTA